MAFPCIVYDDLNKTVWVPIFSFTTQYILSWLNGSGRLIRRKIINQLVNLLPLQDNVAQDTAKLVLVCMDDLPSYSLYCRLTVFLECNKLLWVHTVPSLLLSNGQLEMCVQALKTKTAPLQHLTLYHNIQNIRNELIHAV